MSAPSMESRGLIGNAMTGYHLAWIHRRRLLAVVLPILAPALLGLVLLNLFLGRDQTVIVNGALLFHGDSGVLPWAKAGLSAAAWLLALIAGTLAVAEASARPLRTILIAIREFPAVVIVLGAAAGAGVLLLRVVAGAAEGRLGVALVLLTLLATAVVAARLLIGVLSRSLGGPGWELTRGRTPSTAGAFLLGGVVVPLVLSYARDQVRATSWPLLVEVIDPVLLTGVVAAQAGILAHICLLDRAQEEPAEARAPRFVWLGAVAMVAPVLLSIGFAIGNPYGVPSLRSFAGGPAGGAMALAWPAKQHPVMVTNIGARFCDNDLCDRFVERDGGPPVMDGWGTAGIGPDGAVVKAAVSGSKERGGPFIHYTRCTRDGCPEAWLPVRASSREAFGWPEIAVAAAADGAIWFVLAVPSPDEQAGAPTYRISFIRCPDVACAKPQRHPAGTLERTPADGYPDNRRARLSIGADGRPIAVFWIGQTLQTITCEPVTCAAPRKSWTPAGTPDALWVTPPGPGDAAVSLEPGRLRVGEQLIQLEAAQIAPRSGALAMSGSRVYATAAVSTTRPAGFHFTVGTPPEYWQQVLWICERASCRRQPLDVFQGAAGPEMLAVGPDGRALIVRGDRVTLVTPSASTPAGTLG
jgi:hypothetical protein